MLKAALIGGACFIAAADLRRFERLVSLVVFGLALWVPAGLLILFLGEHPQDVELLGVTISMTAILVIAVVFEGALAVAFALLHRAAFRAWHRIGYMTSGQFRTVTALAEAFYWSSSSKEDAPADITPERVAENADNYLGGFEARRKWVMGVALTGINLYPVLFVNPPFTLMAVDERRAFLERHFGDDVARRRIGSFRRWLVQGMIRLGQQIVYLGYYGDPASWAATGYVPFSRRPEGLRAKRKEPGTLVVEDGRNVTGDLDAEVVIVGSGAAGAVMGYRLAEQGHRVLICERGHHVDPASFSEDEVEMLSSLYRDGALQIARDFKLQVLQGMCVGGTTVINNAVSIEPPDEVLDEWDRRLGDAFDPARVRAAVASIKELLDIRAQPSRYPQPGSAQVHRRGRGARARSTRRAATSRSRPISADCLGCGYCNIGCAYGRKLSMLDTLLPWAQERFGLERLRIVAETSVEGDRDQRRPDRRDPLQGRGPQLPRPRQALRDRGRRGQLELPARAAAVSAGRASGAGSRSTSARRSRPSSTRS